MSIASSSGARGPRLGAALWAALASIAGCPSDPSPGDGGSTHGTEAGTSTPSVDSTVADETTTPGGTTTADETTNAETTTGGAPQCESGKLELLPGQRVDTQPSAWVELVDIDEDGALDIVSARSTGFVVLRGAGDGTFAQSDAAGTPSPPRGFAFGDFDANGTIDLAVALYTAQLVEVYPGNGDGTLGPGVVEWDFGGADVRDIAASDIDGDGDLDLVLGRDGQQPPGVLWGRGDGSFEWDVLPLEPHTTIITPVDLDGAGPLDLVLGGYFSTELVVMRGAPGGVPDYDAYPGDGGIRSIAVRDADGDEVLDLITIESDDETLSLRRGTGTGTFEDAEVFPLPFNPFHMGAGDFDCDGRTDLAIVPSFEDELVIIGGTGELVTMPTTAMPVYVAVGDLDNDGVDDVVVAGNTVGDASGPVVHLAAP